MLDNYMDEIPNNIKDSFDKMYKIMRIGVITEMEI